MITPLFLAKRLAGYAVIAYFTAGMFFTIIQDKFLFPAPESGGRAAPAGAGLVFEDFADSR